MPNNVSEYTNCKLSYWGNGLVSRMKYLIYYAYTRRPTIHNLSYIVLTVMVICTPLESNYSSFQITTNLIKDKENSRGLDLTLPVKYLNM
jgi:hypothetical protein